MGEVAKCECKHNFEQISGKMLSYVVILNFCVIYSNYHFAYCCVRVFIDRNLHSL